jgi:hypothetical protein
MHLSRKLAKVNTIPVRPGRKQLFGALQKSLSSALFPGDNVTTPCAGMITPTRLLAAIPFNIEFNGWPSCLKRSTRTVAAADPEFTNTISVAHPPPAAK